MASRLFGTKPLSEPMLIDCLLYSREKIVQIWSPWSNFPISKWNWKCSLKKTQPFFRPQCFNIPNYWFGPCFDASLEAAHITKWHPWSTAVYIHGLHFQLYKWKTILGMGDLFVPMDYNTLGCKWFMSTSRQHIYWSVFLFDIYGMHAHWKNV